MIFNVRWHITVVDLQCSIFNETVAIRWEPLTSSCAMMPHRLDVIFSDVTFRSLHRCFKQDSTQSNRLIWILRDSHVSRVLPIKLLVGPACMRACNLAKTWLLQRAGRNIIDLLFFSLFCHSFSLNLRRPILIRIRFLDPLVSLNSVEIRVLMQIVIVDISY